jgi:uncharacterized protein YecT (DUF1311 family)
VRRIITVLIICLIIIPALSRAQEDKQTHPIDIAYSKCLDVAQSNVDARECSAKAYDMWDKELNKYYTILMKILNDNGKTALKTAQLQWIKYREAEFKLGNEIIGTKPGTMWLQVTASSAMNFVKRRALELKEYYEILDE